MLSKKNHSIEALMSSPDLYELDPTELAQVMGGGFFSDVIDKIANWCNEGNDGSVGSGLVTVGKLFVAGPAIVTLAAAAHGEHLITGH